MNLTSSKTIKILLVLLAFTLQTQLTLFKSADYIGIRINLTDLILPFIGLFILFSLLTKKTLWPQFAIKGAYLWLIGLGGILCIALLNSYYTFGEISSWGVQNKIIGWGVLSGLFLMGGWLGENAEEKDILTFFKIAAILLFSVALTQISLQLFRFHTGRYLIDHDIARFPIAALMANKNSFIFFYLVLFSFLTFLSKESKTLKKLEIFSYFLLPLIFLFTGARSAFIALPFIFILLFIFNKKENWKKLLQSLLIGTIIAAALGWALPHKVQSLTPKNIESFSKINQITSGQDLSAIANNIENKGDANRLNVLHHVFGMIKEKPFLGSGLGSVLITQVQEKGSYIDLMDCTALWLWAETGLVGLLFFLTFYVLCFRAIWKKSRDQDAPEFTQDFCKAAMLMLITFGIMSLFHELLYTRFLWVFLGMALTLPVTRRA